MTPTLFVCKKCNAVDCVELAAPKQQGSDAWLCTECQGKPWHNHFPKEQYDPDTDLVINLPNGIGLG